MTWTRPPAGATTRLPISETLGLNPLKLRLAEARFALRGDPHIPPSRFGLSSIKVFRPKVSVPTWLGLWSDDKRVPITNLFNRRPTPPEDGWSVRVTSVEDYRGGTLTYDSHNGTDFAVPVGTTVASPAPGRVVRVNSEFHRGGLKIFIDHGQGVATSCNHLGRSFVREGDRVARGEPIALSAYSGLDGVVSFPWVAPHIHFNVFLDGVHVDPFAKEHSDEVSMWLDGDPTPVMPGKTIAEPADFEPSELSESRIDAVIDGCRDGALRDRLARLETVEARFGELLFRTTYFPTLFATRESLYAGKNDRRPLLSLPLLSVDFEGVWFADP